MDHDSVPGDIWVSYVVTWSHAGRLAVYIKGTFVGEDTNGALQDFFPDSHIPVLSAVNPPPQQFFTGLIDDFRIYQRELSASEVKQLASRDGSSADNLTVKKEGQGSGIVTGPGINCGFDCSELVLLGDSVTLTAVASAGSRFSGWAGEGCHGVEEHCTVAVGGSTKVKAFFAPDEVKKAVFIPGFLGTRLYKYPNRNGVQDSGKEQIWETTCSDHVLYFSPNLTEHSSLIALWQPGTSETIIAVSSMR